VRTDRLHAGAVVNKTVVFLILVALIAIVYLAIVVGIGGALGGGNREPNPVLSVGAVSLIAFGFRPVQERVRRLVNRLVYGERATPYEVMSDFSRRMSGALSVDEIMPRMAEAAASGVGAARSTVCLFMPSGKRLSVSWPRDEASDHFDSCVDVTLRGEPVGQILVAEAPGETITPAEEKLLADLASQAGLALHNVRLAAELRARFDEISMQAQELKASRSRLVTAQDVSRHRLQRAILDGPESRLVDMVEKLDHAERVIDDDPKAVTAALDALIEEAKLTLESLRDLAHGIFSPLLADRGIVAALTAYVRKSKLVVTIDAEASLVERRFEQPLEAAVYFCCVEALTNITRHARGAVATIRLQESTGRLAFSVCDEGPGFDAGSTPWAPDLQLMGDRLAALGGTVEIHSIRGAGTTVMGTLPTATDAQSPAAAQASANRRGANSDFEMNAAAPHSAAPEP